MNITKATVSGAVIWQNDAFGPLEPRIFDTSWLHQSGMMLAAIQGRQKAYILRHAGNDMVLRHFRRGGLMGKINRDLYLKASVEESRAMKEFVLLSWMRDQGLPVPRPVAARYQPAGLFYRADIITELIPNSRPMVEWMQDGGLALTLWQKVGRAIGFMHRLGVHHADLNGRNILIEGQQKIWLIDFDKCERRAPGDWSGQNLARLKRFFDKEKNRQPGLQWTEEVWLALLEGHKAEFAG